MKTILQVGTRAASSHRATARPALGRYCRRERAA
jgi:hypothetical protein